MLTEDMMNSVLQRSPSVFMVSETSEYFWSDGARAVAVSNVRVCFHGLARLWPRWLVCPAVSSRSVVILTPPSSSPPLCSLAQIFLPDGDAGGATRLSPAGVHDLISPWPTCQTLLQSSTQADVLKPAPDRAPSR